jgi:uncharacterized protein YndB with AHSA1/START domain
MVNEIEPKQVHIPPVEKTFQVRLPVERAFRLFTQEIHTWWPLESHSVGGDQAHTCVFESEAGGRIYEIQRDGTESEWGRVLAWEPPHRVTFTWHPGRQASTAQEVEVTFEETPGGTSVRLTHRGWETLGEKAQETRRGYDTGWDKVLGRYMQEAGSLK